MKKLLLLIMTGLVIVGLSSCDDHSNCKKNRKHDHERHERRW